MVSALFSYSFKSLSLSWLGLTAHVLQSNFQLMVVHFKVFRNLETGPSGFIVIRKALFRGRCLWKNAPSSVPLLGGGWGWGVLVGFGEERELRKLIWSETLPGRSWVCPERRPRDALFLSAVIYYQLVLKSVCCAVCCSTAKRSSPTVEQSHDTWASQWRGGDAVFENAKPCGPCAAVSSHHVLLLIHR